MTIDLKERTLLAKECIKNNLSKEKADLALKQINIYPEEIRQSNELLIYYNNLIEYLVIRGELENWLIELSADGLLFAKDWLKKIIAMKKTSPPPTNGSISNIEAPKSKDKEEKFKIPLPQIKRKFTQREIDVFLKDGFSIIKEYFRKALSELEQQSERVETDLTETGELKFTCKVYVDGNTKNQCKIWLGGFLETSISYSSGYTALQGDNCFGDYINVENDGQQMYFKVGNVSMMSKQEKRKASPYDAAEYLWRSFISSLET